MSIFSRGSKKRKEFVEGKQTETNKKTGENYTEKEANNEYMKEKKEWAASIIKGLEACCNVLCDPQGVWETREEVAPGGAVFWAEFNKVNYHINGIMNSERYKNVLAGGSSSKYLQQAQDELGKLMARAYNHYTDPENIKSSVRSCGKGLSKLKHPIGSTALVKVGGKGKRIVDYVDKLARLLLDRNVQENAAILVALGQDADWPGDENKN